MNKNKILSVVTLVIIFGGIIWLAKPGPNQSDEANAVAGTNFSGTNSGDNYHKTGEAESGYALEAPETFYNFGEISMKNSNVKHDFTVKNNTSRSINGLSPYPKGIFPSKILLSISIVGACDTVYEVFITSSSGSFNKMYAAVPS